MKHAVYSLTLNVSKGISCIISNRGKVSLRGHEMANFHPLQKKVEIRECLKFTAAGLKKKKKIENNKLIFTNIRILAITSSLDLH